jgi:peptidoglycan/LPS O-acetylase OafA/YrhL
MTHLPIVSADIAPLAPGHVPGLDGLRGVAAFMVVVSHTLIQGTDVGGLAVFLFFILSGFLITRLLIRSRGAIEAGRSTIGRELKSFWLGRALRIFPAYYVWLALFLIVDHVYYHDQTLKNVVWYLLYVQNFLIAFKTHAWEDFTHTWSLAVEQQFYVFFAPLVLVIAVRGHVMLFVATGLFALGIDWVLMLSGADMLVLYPIPSTGFVFMAAGALLATTQRDSLKPLANPFLVGVSIMLVVLLATYPVFERNDIAHVPYVVLVAASAASLAVILAAIIATPAGLAARILETPVPRLFGRISYALYIIHLPVSLWMWDFGGMDDLAALTHIPAEIICFAAVLAVSVPLALLSYRFVEKPFLDLKRGLKAGKPITLGVPV